jgi:hypothetical protein
MVTMHFEGERERKPGASQQGGIIACCCYQGNEAGSGFDRMALIQK